MKKKILVIEDNHDHITLYEDILGTENELKIVTSLLELKKLLDSNSELSFDLVISDLKLPDGLFLDWVENNESNIIQKFPTIIVSSLEDLDVLRACFEWGATDYLIKPFKVNELIAKVDKACRSYIVKTQIDSAQSLLDELTSMERKIFQRFLATPNSVITRETLVGEIWKKVAVHPKTFDVHLSNLRRKLSTTEWSIDNLHEKGWKLSRKNKDE